MARPGGHFDGKLVVELQNDGKLIKLVEPFAYVDPLGFPWPVPKGCRVDGASIPRVLWTLVGSPLTGKYRNASVIHDHYCDTRSRTWGAVHRVFFDAMRTSGVGLLQSKILYAGVRWGGPRWAIEVVNNYFDTLDDYLNDVAADTDEARFPGHHPRRVHKPMMGPDMDDVSAYDRTYLVVKQHDLTQADLDEFQRTLDGVDVDMIGALVDERIRERKVQPTEIARTSVPNGTELK